MNQSRLYSILVSMKITVSSVNVSGSRIMYDRQFLLDCRNSPLARSPLQNLPNIPGVTCDLDATHAGKSASKKQNKRGRNGSRKKRTSPEGDELFYYISGFSAILNRRCKLEPCLILVKAVVLKWIGRILHTLLVFRLMGRP